jgi:Cytochrome bd terminal oxidase subunit I
LGADLFPLAADLSAARSQMAFTLGFHIVLACIGVGFPAIILVANYLGLKRNDPVALGLAQRWSKVAAVTFIVGAITGTVLSFEMGLLWPEFMRRSSSRSTSTAGTTCPGGCISGPASRSRSPGSAAPGRWSRPTRG